MNAPSTLLAVKCVKQCCSLTPLLPLMESFRQMVNECIRIGLQNNVSTMKRLSKLCYPQLAEYDVISYYKLHAISKAAGILANRKQSIKRCRRTRDPYLKKPILVSSYGFKIIDGSLRVPTGDRQYFDIRLNAYTRHVLSGPGLTVHSFTLATGNSSLSICYSKEIPEIDCTSNVGVDRNLTNLTVGNIHSVKQYDLSKASDIVENTRSLVRSFRRNDVRIRRRLAGKYGKRRANRVNQLLHHVSRFVVKNAKNERTSVAFEKLINIRNLYRKGNRQGRNYRSKLNGWSFAEIKRQIAYKAKWEGIPVIQLSASQTGGTSQLCPQCGKRLQEDRLHRRELFCCECNRWLDRDVVAAMNISRKGAEVFQRSRGLAGEAMVEESGSVRPVILRVDASKFNRRGMSLY